MGNTKSRESKIKAERSISSVTEEIKLNSRARSSMALKLPPNDLPKCVLRHWRAVIINAYIHELKMELIAAHQDSGFATLIEISQDINTLMIEYYPLKQIYGIGGNLITIGEHEVLQTFTKLEKYEQIVYDPNQIYFGKYKHFVMDFWNDIYGHGWNQNDDLGLNYDHQGGNYRFIIDFQPTAIKNYIKQIDFGQKIEIVSNSVCALQNSEPSLVFKLENGSIYYSVRIKSQLKFERLSQQYLNIIQIECGDNFVIFLTKDGKVFSMGSNNKGQCGIDSDKVQAGMIYDPMCIETLVVSECIISSISVGTDNSCAVDSTRNDLWVWGGNEYNKSSETVSALEKIKIPMLSNVSYDYDIIKAGMGYLFTCCVTVDKSIILLGELKKHTKEGCFDHIKVKDLSVGAEHIIVLDETDNIWTLGSNNWSQCGFHNKQDSWKVTKPYLLDKSDSVFPGLMDDSTVNRVIATAGQSVIIFD